MPDDFSNPLAPPDHHHRTDDGGNAATQQSDKHPLKNEDFRKLLMTPRVVGTGDKPHVASAHSFTHKGGHSSSDAKKKGDPKQHRKTKHVRPKKEDEDDLDDIMKNYRDRAKERREGETTEHSKEIDLLQATAGYRAVAPDVKSTMDAAERRKQMIEESKYLGGDMEHTHLVKGLDFALLQKVRSEITSKEKEGEELDKIYLARITEREEVESQIKTPLAKSIYNSLFKNELAKINELFAPRRMAYVVELDDEYGDTDIPTTLIRSKQECPVDEAGANLSINDVVIKKLTQVLSYLQTDTKKKKKEKGKDKIDEATRAQLATQSIYDTSAEYVPDLKKSSDEKKTKKDGSYFDRPSEEEEKSSKSDRDKERKEREKSRQQLMSKESEKKYVNEKRQSGADQKQKDRVSESAAQASGSRTEERSKGGTGSSKRDHDPLRKTPTAAEDGGVRMDAAAAPDSYAECYPGMCDYFDAEGDSDDEVDYSKMDMGNRKGPIRRWDFDTEQEYEEYMSRREAMPKAAFQYGVKMNDGRKTRKVPGQKNEADQKAKIDKQWNKISKILTKRQGEGDGESAHKKPKY